MAASLAIGTVMATLRVWGGPVLSNLAGAYVEFFRNTPLLVQLLFYAVLLAPAYLNVTREPLVAAAIGLSVYTAAYVTEAVRSLGLSQVQSLRLVVLPQAVRTVIPPLGNLAIALVKNTSIASGIAAFDVLKAASTLESRTLHFEWYIAAVIAFWAITIPLAFV